MSPEAVAVIHKSCEACWYWHERVREDRRKRCTAPRGLCATTELENFKPKDAPETIARKPVDCTHEITAERDGVILCECCGEILGGCDEGAERMTVEKVILGSGATEEERVGPEKVAHELTKKPMNRAEKRLYHMQERILASAKWSKMVQRVEFGKEVAPYKLVEVKLNGHLKATNAQAFSDKIEFSKSYYKVATPKSLMRTVKHEMAHVLLLQNGISDGHSPLYKTCCHILGLSNPNAKESGYNYKHICDECGWWLKAMQRREKISHVCKGKFVHLVSKAEYQKLAKIAKIGSKTCAVNIEAYRVMTVTCIKQNLKLKEGGS